MFCYFCLLENPRLLALVPLNNLNGSAVFTEIQLPPLSLLMFVVHVLCGLCMCAIRVSDSLCVLQLTCGSQRTSLDVSV